MQQTMTVPTTEADRAPGSGDAGMGAMGDGCTDLAVVLQPRVEAEWTLREQDPQTPKVEE